MRVHVVRQHSRVREARSADIPSAMMQRVYVRSGTLPGGSRGANGLRSSLSTSPSSRLYRRNAFALRYSRRYTAPIRAMATCPASYASLVAWKDDFNERFILEESIGRGSFGEVWLATEKATRQRVAVKEMPRRRGRLSAEGTFAKVDREICVMQDVKACPAAVQFRECHALPNSYRIVMEYCSGLDLREQIRRYGPASEEVTAHVAYEILLILKKCHANRIVHGDVKTANFILRSAKENPFATNDTSVLTKGWLKAIDFGCSQYILNGKRMSSRVGTPVFMAPEVFDRDYSFESDLWSLGIVLYQLISGRFPFWDSTQTALMSSVQDVMETVHLNDPDFTNEPFDRISAECLDFLQRLLDKNYKSRMDTKEALEHPFIRRYIGEEDPAKSYDDINNNIVPTLASTLNSAPTVTSATVAAAVPV